MSSRLPAWVIAITSAAVLLLEPAFSQGRGGGTSTGTGTGTSAGAGAGAGSGAGTTTGRIPGTTTTTPGTVTPGTPTNNGAITQRHVLFITGKFVLEEGGPPPDTVVVERICNGSAKAEGYSDSQGTFSIQVGDEQGVFQDASETSTYSGGGNSAGTGLGPRIGGGTGGSGAGGTSDMRYANCDLRGKLTGFRSQTVSLANRHELDDPNIGVILLHREGKDEGSTVSAISLAAPRDARRAFEKGLQLLKKNKTDEAEKEFRKAVAQYPKYADAWNEIGRIQLDSGDKFAARQSFQTAIQADPKFVNPYLQISLLDMDEKNWPDLASVTDQALKLDPFDYARAWLFNGAAYWNLKQFDKAEKSIREAERLDGQHTLPDVSRLMGMILMYRHDYAGAIEYMHAYLKVAPPSEDVDKVRVQLAQAERLKAQNEASASAKQDR